MNDEDWSDERLQAAYQEGVTQVGKIVGDYLIKEGLLTVGQVAKMYEDIAGDITTALLKNLSKNKDQN